MGTTTFEALREEQEGLIAALTPTSFTSVPFHEHRDEIDIRQWAEENPQACLRRFAIRDTFEYEPEGVTNTDVIWEEGSSVNNDLLAGTSDILFATIAPDGTVGSK